MRRIKGTRLTFDPDFQRWFDKAHVAKIETNWSLLLLGVLIVSLRDDGKHYLIDGMHRYSAGLAVDPSMIYNCLVWEGLTPKMEAEIFMGLNGGRRGVRPYDMFKTALRAEHDIEISMNEQTLRRGLKLGYGPSANVIGAVTACKRIVTRDKGATDLLEHTLMVAEDAWGRAGSSWDNNMLQAIALVIYRNRANVDFARLSSTLRTRTVDGWKGLAMASLPGGGGSVSRSNKMVELIIPAYNKRLGAPKKIK